VGVQVRWDGGGTAPAGVYTRTRFYGEGTENHERGTDSSLHKRIISADKRAGFVSDRMSYIIPRRLWCAIIVLNVHAPTQDKTDMKDRCYEEIEHVFDKFLKYHMKILLRDFNAKLGREGIFKPTRN
jgi:hypothetical protein